MEISHLKEQLRNLEQSISDLNDLLDEGVHAYAAFESGQFLREAAARDMIKSAFSSLWYEGVVEDGRCTPIWLGSLAVSQPVLDAARKVNAHKDDFRKSVVAAKSSIKVNESMSNAGTAKSFRRLMKEVGFPRLSLRKTYRHIPVIDSTPLSIRFSYSGSGKSISRITPEEALKELLESGFTGSHIDFQVKILGLIPPDTELAKVQQLAGYYKANFRFEEEPFKKTTPTFLPILYLLGDKPPDHQAEIPAPSISHKLLRNDRKLCSFPLIPTLHIHAYH